MASDDDVQLRNLARSLAKMRDDGRLTPEEYDEQVALLPSYPSLKPPNQTQKHPDSLSELVATEEVEQPAKAPSKTNEEWMVHYLKETADQAGKQTALMETITGWVTFFGVLTVISLVAWGLYLLFLAMT